MFKFKEGKFYKVFDDYLQVVNISENKIYFVYRNRLLSSEIKTSVLDEFITFENFYVKSLDEKDNVYIYDNEKQEFVENNSLINHIAQKINLNIKEFKNYYEIINYVKIKLKLEYCTFVFFLTKFNYMIGDNIWLK